MGQERVFLVLSVWNPCGVPGSKNSYKFVAA
jgi:hypothetical protein